MGGWCVKFRSWKWASNRIQLEYTTLDLSTEHRDGSLFLDVAQRSSQGRRSHPTGRAVTNERLDDWDG